MKGGTEEPWVFPCLGYLIGIFLLACFIALVVKLELDLDAIGR